MGSIMDIKSIEMNRVLHIAAYRNRFDFLIIRDWFSDSGNVI